MVIHFNKLMKAWLTEFDIDIASISMSNSENAILAEDLTKLSQKIQESHLSIPNTETEFWAIYSDNKVNTLGILDLDFEHLNYFDAVKLSFHLSVLFSKNLFQASWKKYPDFYVMLTYSLGENISSTISWGRVMEGIPITKINEFETDGILIFSLM